MSRDLIVAGTLGYQHGWKLQPMCRKEKRTGGGVELNMAKELGHMVRLSWSKIDRIVDIQVDSLWRKLGVAQGGTASQDLPRPRRLPVRKQA
jgi:hypothetical protein